jgi:hypothetical protein
MVDEGFQRWEQDFRRAAKADKYGILRDHLRKLDLPDCPKLLLEGTIHLVRACLAYASLDGQSPLKFLEMQKYNPDDRADVMYAVTFDLYGKAFARVLALRSITALDFADLYGHAWEGYEICGYSRLWISHTDGSRLAPEELVHLKMRVTGDLRFDYSEEELDLWFDDLSTEGALMVTVQDCQ